MTEISIEKLLRENEDLKAEIYKLYAILWEGYSMRGRVYSDNEPMQATLKEALDICRNALAKKESTQ